MTQKIRSTAVSYDVMEYLGEGLNSVVYKAVRSDPFCHLQQTVALKILKSRNLVETWRSEFDSLARVQCIHCVRVFGFEWVGDKPALVLEFIRGVSLRQFCLAGPVELNVGQEILAQVQAGLRSLHETGICHGDLSPNNVMIDCHGCVKLLDFGGAGHATSHVQATPAFAAPELLNGDFPSFASDLFSLGVLEKMLLHRETARLSKDPAQRPCFEMPCDPRSQERLAQSVQKLTDHQTWLRNLATKSVLVARTTEISFRSLFIAVILLLAPNSQALSKFGPSGLLSIRSHGWLRLALDDDDLGFAPMDVLVKAAESHQLRWRSAVRSGVTAIELRSGETKLITGGSL